MLRMLCDENVATAIVRHLRDAGHDVLWVQEACPGVNDKTVADLAIKEQRLLITSDIGLASEMLRRGSAQYGTMLLRLYHMKPAPSAKWLVEILQTRSDWHQFQSVLTEKKVRTRPLSLFDQT